MFNHIGMYLMALMDTVRTRKHVLLVRALHGHVFVHLLDVEVLMFSQRDLRVGHNVLDVAVDDVVLDVHKEVAHDAGHADGGQQAFVPVLAKNHSLKKWQNGNAKN